MYDFILDKIYRVIKGTGKDIMDSLANDIVSNFKTSPTYPAGSRPYIGRGNLANAILGKNSVNIDGDNYYERRISLPYANILLKGFSQMPTIKQRVYFNSMYKKTGDIKWLKMKKASKLVLKPMNYVRPSLQDHSPFVQIIKNALINAFGE